MPVTLNPKSYLTDLKRCQILTEVQMTGVQPDFFLTVAYYR